MTRVTKMTQARKDTFLDHLSVYGIVGHAAKHATPSAKDKRSARTVFYQAREDDHVFAEAWDKALEDAEDVVIEEMRRRGVDGYDEPVFGSGGPGCGTEQVGSKRVYSDRMLELYSRVKSMRVRKALTNKTELEVSGNVTHSIGVKDLSPENQEALQRILESHDTE